MYPINVLDKYYLVLAILVTTGYQALGFFIAWTFQFDKITDFTGGSNFFILALLTLILNNTGYARVIVASVLVMVWAARLAAFLLFRVLKMGSDSRFDNIRSHFFKFMGFWIGQIVWVWTVSLPLIILNSPAVSNPLVPGRVTGIGRTNPSNPAFGTSRDIAGIVLWTLGWVIETVADIQKYRYKSSKPPKREPPSFGIWKYSRHPPYFGEMMCWWGIWILCLSPTTNGDISASARRAQYGAIMSPIFTTLLLMFASGVPTAEKPQAKRYYLLSHGASTKEENKQAWANYKDYLRSTSILIPLPPALYRRLPGIVKKTILFDFPMYQFNENTDGVEALAEDKKRADSEAAESGS